MKSKLIPIALICVCAGVARAGFNPVVLTPGSYNCGLVVGTNTPKILPYCITATSGDGTALGDYTYFEQTWYAAAGQPGSNIGIPAHGTILTNISNPNVTFQMPASYLTNDDLQIDASHTTATFTFTAQPTFKYIAILAGGSAASVVNYSVAAKSGVFGVNFTGTLNLSDWFYPTNGTNVAQIAWGANGRVSDTGGIEIESTSNVNNAVPYLYAYYITLSAADPLETIKFTWSSGTEEANIYAISGSTNGTSYTPIAVTGYNQMTTVPAFSASPVSATMDNGTNLNTPGNTWFETGYYGGNTSYGLPHSGTQFTAPSGHVYQMGSYAQGSNNAVLIDAFHLSSSITPSNPALYTAFTFLTSGSYIGASGQMTNICVVQHQDGVNETNQFIAYDWLNTNVTAAWNANGRFYLDLNPEYGCTFNSVGSPVSLFESFVILNDTNSPVTNILVKYYEAPATNSTTSIMAISGTDGAVPPLIISGPSPATQTWFAGQTATFTVAVEGTTPITNIWLVRSNNTYVTLTNGVDANGSTISGATTTTLTISDLAMADGTNYVYLADNAAGQATSLPVSLIVSNDAYATAPVILSQSPSASVSTMSIFPNVPAEVSVTVNAASPPISYQWYNGLPQGPATAIPNATNAGYVFSNLNGATLSCLVTNIVGVAASSPVTITDDKSPISSPASYQAVLLGYNPVAYWPLNETSGSVAYDLVGNNNGNYIGNCTLGVAGVSNAAGFGSSSTSVGFDGSTGFVDIPVNNLNITGPMSVVEWIQTTNANTGVVGDIVGHSDNSYRSGVDADGDPNFADDSPGGLDATGANSVADGQWHQLVGVYDGTMQYIYVDGLLAGTRISSVPTGSSDDVEIASTPDYTNRFFAGNICQVSILTNALTSNQVSALYSTADFPPELVTDVTPLLSSVPVGAPLSFSVTAVGSPPLFYQWSNQNGAISGATNASYAFDVAVGTNSYYVSVSNAYGATVSSMAVVLGITNPPTLLNLDAYTNWTLNGGPYADAPEIVGGVLELTDGNGSEMTSSFNSAPQYIGGFIASFTYTHTPATGGADGITFCLQNSESGSNALGNSASGGGSGLGYDVISPSFALEMDIYTHGGDGPGGTTTGPGITFGTNGSTPYSVTPAPCQGYFGTAPVNLNSGNPIYAQLYYLQGVLHVWLIDSETLAEYTTNIVENLPGIVGGYDAYVGFTGADGGVASAQYVSNFTFSSTTLPILSVARGATPGTVIVSWPFSVSSLFTLLQSSSLAGPWSQANESTLTQVGLQYQVTLAPAGATYYKLQLTAPNAP